MDTQALGRYLRQTRETRELTLEEAERTLRIRRRVLEAFELGEFSPSEFSPVQVRGFVRNYAVFLGLDPERVLQQLTLAQSGGSRPERRTSSLIGGASSKRGRGKRDTGPAPAVSASTRSITDTPHALPAVSPGRLPDSRGTGTPVVVWLLRLLVAAAALAIIVFVAVQLVQPTPTVEDPEPGILAVLPPSQTFTPVPSFTPAPTVIALVQPTTAFSGEGVQVIVEMEQRSWMRVRVDEVEQFAGIARPGERYDWVAVERIEINAASAEALRVTYNGQRQPSLGARGQRVDLVFTPANLTISTGPGYDPTAEQSSTPLPTPPPADGSLLTPATLPPTETAQAAASLASPEAAEVGAVRAGSRETAALPLASPTLMPLDAFSLTAVVGGSSTAPTPTLSESIPMDQAPPLVLSPTLDPLFAETATAFSQPAADAQAPAAAQPSATPLPTATATPRPSETPRPSPTATPRPSETPRPTATATPLPTETPRPTAIVPPRVNSPNATLPPTKAPGR
jgi:hypothetical protein